MRVLDFRMPHSPRTTLLPLIDPITGDAVDWYSSPLRRFPTPTSPSKPQVFRYGSDKVHRLLIDQYSLMFHAAANEGVFVAALECLPNLQQLRLSCPSPSQRDFCQHSCIDAALRSIQRALKVMWNHSSIRLPLDTIILDDVGCEGVRFLMALYDPRTSHRLTTLRLRVRHCSRLDSACTQQLQKCLLSYDAVQYLSFKWLGTGGPFPLPTDSEIQSKAFQLVHGVAPWFPRAKTVKLDNVEATTGQIQSVVRSLPRGTLKVGSSCRRVPTVTEVPLCMDEPKETLDTALWLVSEESARSHQWDPEILLDRAFQNLRLLISAKKTRKALESLLKPPVPRRRGRACVDNRSRGKRTTSRRTDYPKAPSLLYGEVLG